MSFMNNYLKYTENSESPLIFHKWVGLTTISSVVKRSVYVNKDHYDVFPNLWTILVAPSGVCRKTSAIKIGESLLREVDDINILSEKITPEAIVNSLSTVTVKDKKIVTEACGVILAKELAVFLGRERYNEGIVALLTDLSDCPKKWSSTTKGGGTAMLENVCITFFGASTPDWIVEALPASIFGGGFMSRCIFVYKDTTDRVIPMPIAGPLDIRNSLVRSLKAIQQRSGAVVWTAKSLTHYTKWYLSYRKGINMDKKFASYIERKPDNLIKLCILLILEKNKDLIITEDIIDESVAYLDELEAGLPEAFAQMETSIHARNVSNILTFLTRATNELGEVSHKTVLRAFYSKMTSKEINSILLLLKEADIIDTSVSLDGEKMYRIGAIPVSDEMK